MTTATALRTDSLTAGEVAEFYRRGFIRVGRVLDGDEIDGAQAHLSELAERASQESLPGGIRHTVLDEDDGGQQNGEPPSARFVVLHDVRRGDSLLRTLALKPSIAQWGQQLLGSERAALITDESFVKRPGGGELGWHQDYLLGSDHVPHFVTCWVAVDDATGENGALRMLAGSHHLGRFLPMGYQREHVAESASSEQDAVRLRAMEDAGLRAMPRELVGAFPEEELALQAGECTFHHPLIWHRSGDNLTGSWRRALIQRFRPVPWPHSEFAHL
jgi:hypothetical protein